MKSQDKKIAVYITSIVLLFILSYTFGKGRGEGDLINAWYINLDRSKERNDQMREEIKNLNPIPAYRWTAVDGKTLNEKDYDRFNIPFWSRPTFAKESKENQRKGEIGIYLSQKTLLEHLKSQPAKPDDCHLILEDDVHIDKNFYEKWRTIQKELPDNWDMLFVAQSNDHKQSRQTIHLYKSSWITGCYGYIVKHSSIPKILDNIKIMFEPIDDMFGRNPAGLSIFVARPYLITTELNESTIR